MKTFILTLVVASLVLGFMQPAPAPAALKPKATPPITKAKGKAPAMSPADLPVMAYVQGKPIYMSELNDLLVQSYGLSMSRQLIATELVRQAAEAKGIALSDKDVQAETDETSREMFSGIDQASQRERLLDQFLVQRGMSQEQWRIIMRRNVMLRKLAEPQVKVTDEQVNDEFAEQYGRKVEVRHIQTDSLASAQDILKQIHEGADFAEVAKKVSANPTSAANGGLLPPIGANTPSVPLPIRQAATAMKKAGDISDPVQVETAFHIFKVERIIEPQNVKLIDVKDKLITAVRKRQLRTIEQQLLQDIIRKSQESGQIQYVDPTLKAQSLTSEQATSQPK